MATNFPTGLDTLTNPAPTDVTDAPSHSGQHINSNDAIEAMQAKIGIDGSAVTSSLDYKVNNPASSDPGHTHTLGDGATDVTASPAEINQLAGVTVGGNASGDIVTTDGTQDLSNKSVTDKLTFDANTFANLLETGVEPLTPATGDVYLDDGTNTASGLPSLRRYTGAVWEDMSGGTPSPLTTKGDLYTYDTDNARLPVGTDGLVLKANSATTTGVEWGTPTTGGGGGVPYFLHEEVSDIGGGYRKLLNTPADDAENTDTAVVNSGTGEVLIRAFASDAGNPNAAIWLSGIWNFDTWASVDSAVGTTTIVIRVYKRTEPGGVETELFNITTDEIDALTATLTSKETVQPEETTNTTDRLVVKYFAQSTSGVNRTVTLYYEGTANYSHFHAPFQTQAVSPLTTKGDLYGFTTVDARVPVGANDKVLTADSTVAAGIAWKDASSQALVKGEVPTGAIDSSNVTFTLATTPITGSVQLYLNGIRLKLTDDYTITGDTITMNTAPITGDTFLADYATSTGTYATGSTSFIYNETPTGTIDGSNTVFDTATNFVAGSILVYLDGQLQKPGGSFDYVETDANTITFNTAPVLGSVLLVSYQSAVSASGNADTVDGFGASATPTVSTLLPLNASGSFDPSVLYPDSWIPSSDTWVYASASSFTISGVDRTSVYATGTKLKFDQTGTKYAVVSSSSFSTNTTVNIIVNTNYTIANAAITSPFYSYATTPPGFPAVFQFTTTYTGFSVNPTGSSFYSVAGRMITATYYQTAGGTSNSINFQMSLPVTVASSSANVGHVGQLHGASDNGVYLAVTAGNGETIPTCWVSSGGSVVTLSRASGALNWTASGTKACTYLTVTYPF